MAWKSLKAYKQEDLLAAIAKDTAVLNEPFLVQQSADVEKLLKDMRVPEDSGVLRLWEEAGGWRKDAKLLSLDSAHYRIEGKQGLPAFLAVLHGVMPRKQLLGDTPVAAVNVELESAYLFGYSSSFVRVDYAAQMLGQLRLVTDGKLKVPRSDF